MRFNKTIIILGLFLIMIMSVYGGGIGSSCNSIRPCSAGFGCCLSTTQCSDFTKTPSKCVAPEKIKCTAGKATDSQAVKILGDMDCMAQITLKPNNYVDCQPADSNQGYIYDHCAVVLKFADGRSCVENRQCTSGICSNMYCVSQAANNPPVDTGTGTGSTQTEPTQCASKGPNCIYISGGHASFDVNTFCGGSYAEVCLSAGAFKIYISVGHVATSDVFAGQGSSKQFNCVNAPKTGYNTILYLSSEGGHIATSDIFGTNLKIYCGEFACAKDSDCTTADTVCNSASTKCEAKSCTKPGECQSGYCSPLGKCSMKTFSDLGDKCGGMYLTRCRTGLECKNGVCGGEGANCGIQDPKCTPRLGQTCSVVGDNTKCASGECVRDKKSKDFACTKPDCNKDEPKCKEGYTCNEKNGLCEIEKVLSGGGAPCEKTPGCVDDVVKRVEIDKSLDFLAELAKCADNSKCLSGVCKIDEFLTKGLICGEEVSVCTHGTTEGDDCSGECKDACSVGLECGTDGKCKEMDCTADADCKDGTLYKCDTAIGSCKCINLRTDQQKCSNEFCPCEEGFYCDSGKGICTANPICINGIKEGDICTVDCTCNKPYDCVNGECASKSCSSTVACTADETCIGFKCWCKETGTKTEGQSCSDLCECENTLTCNNGKCEAQPIICDPVACVAKGKKWACIGTTCVEHDCIDNTDCTVSGETCVSYECKKKGNENGPCVDDSNCPPKQFCSPDKVCINFECITDADCPPGGYKCDGNFCIQKDCDVDDDISLADECGDSRFECVDNKCTPPTECNDNNDCPSSYSCVMDMDNGNNVCIWNERWSPEPCSALGGTTCDKGYLCFGNKWIVTPGTSYCCKSSLPDKTNPCISREKAFAPSLGEVAFMAKGPCINGEREITYYTGCDDPSDSACTISEPEKEPCTSITKKGTKIPGFGTTALITGLSIVAGFYFFANRKRRKM